MLSTKRTLRLALLGAPILALAIGALVLTFGPGTGDSAQAGASVNFAIGVDYNGDGTNDCGTGVPSAVGDGAPDDVTVAVSNTTCAAAPGSTLVTSVYLIDRGGIAYEAAAGHVFYTGAVTSNGAGTSVWMCHIFDASASGAGFENAGSAIGIGAPCNVGQTNLGLMAKFSFTCSGGGTLRLGNAAGETLLQVGAAEHRDAGSDELTVCGSVEPPTATTQPPTDTPAATTPASTPATPTNTSIPPTMTNTPIPTTPATAVPTNTPRPTNTRTPTPAVTKGDVNGDHVIDSEDSLWILWMEAGIVDHVPLPENADVNHDGHINSIDALFILWMETGAIAI